MGDEGHNEELPKKCTSVKSVGVSSDKNARWRRTMEDAHIIVDGFGGVDHQGYFAVYDGHGGRGAVDFTVAHLHNVLLKELEKDGGTSVTQALIRAYKETDSQIGQNQIQFSGATSVSAFIRKQGDEKWLYAANAGDARAVLSRNGKAIRLTYDHKGSDSAEVQRIVDSGGFVVLNRVSGILAVTRSLGDHAMKDYVIGDPFCTETKLLPTDTHLIIACDGLWDVASDQDAVDLIASETDAQKASEKLLLHALKNGSTDNISVMVIIL
jgi:protein phosphatase PTC1